MNADQAAATKADFQGYLDDAAKWLKRSEGDLNRAVGERDAIIADIMEKAKREAAEVRALYADEIKTARQSVRSGRRSVTDMAEAVSTWGKIERRLRGLEAGAADAS